MGGSSDGKIEIADPGIIFSGYVDLDGGGFVTFSLRGIADKLAGATGLLFEFDSMGVGDVGAPLAFATDLYTGDSSGWSWISRAFRCRTLKNAIAVPVTGDVGDATARWFLPFDAFETWASCPRSPPDLNAVRELSIGNVYQGGAFSLRLRSIVATTSSAPESHFPVPVPLPSADAAGDVVRAALARGEFLESKEGGFHPMSYKIYQTTALQASKVYSVQSQLVYSIQ